MKSNLRTTKKPDGSPITKGPADEYSLVWATDTGLYSCPSNSAGNGEDCSSVSTYGMLYQRSALMNNSTFEGAQGICPSGWHVPTLAESTTLIESQSTVGCSGGAFGEAICDLSATKLAGGANWQSSVGGLLLNSSGIARSEFGSSSLDVQPSGLRDESGYDRGSRAYLATSTNSAIFEINSVEDSAIKNSIDDATGVSLRCIKGAASLPPPAPTCSDGTQNGTETGVDCGGSCSACTPPAPTCSDGTQNGTETGVDCGGSCGTVCVDCVFSGGLNTTDFMNIPLVTSSLSPSVTALYRGSTIQPRPSEPYAQPFESFTTVSMEYCPSCSNYPIRTYRFPFQSTYEYEANIKYICGSYSWVEGSYGTCSATCGGGTQIRTVVCKDNSGNTVADSYCTETKPAVSNDCNTNACSTGIACKDPGTLEYSNDICVNYTYGNAQMYIVFPNGINGGPTEWWQSNVVSQGSDIFTGCTGGNLLYKSAGEIANLPDC